MILVIDDEPAIRESLVYALKRDGFSAMQAGTLSEARLLWESALLLILDLMLPDGSGLDFLKAVREQSDIPIIILTSRDDETDRVVGLEVGGDDYVVKPFSPREVVARVRAILRRMDPPLQDSANLIKGPFGITIDLSKKTAMINQLSLDLSKTEFHLLVVLVQKPGHVFTREDLLKQVWGENCSVVEKTVDVHLKSIRKKMNLAGGSPEIIETVRGMGFRIREEA